MKTIFTILLSFNFYIVFSQNITFEQVQNLRKKSISEVEDFLTKKGWSMTEATQETSENMAKVVFGYKVNQFNSEIANAWLIFYPSNIIPELNKLVVQLNTPTAYSLFSNRMISNSYKLKSSKIIDGGIEKVYQNKTTTCIVTTVTTEGEYSKGTAYTFLFVSNLFYTTEDE